jgi:cation-transporting P-type ATPase E
MQNGEPSPTMWEVLVEDSTSRSSSVADDAPIRGLTRLEVEQRRARGEVNRVVSSTSRPIADIMRANFLTLFNAMLTGAILLLIFVGQYRDAVLTGGLVLFSVAISTVQEIRAKRRLDHIAVLARTPVRVIRDGQEMSVDQGDLVLGDYLVLSRGEPVVADGPVALAAPLEIDESLLTGESEPVAKKVGDQVYSGSFCVAGSGVYVAERIGQESYAQKLSSAARQFRSRRTPIQMLLDRVLRALLVIVVALGILEAALFFTSGVSLVEAVRGTAVIATLVPQGLLFMSTVAYSVGAVTLAQAGALVQQLNAVESVSHVDVLCLDKTGTITANRLRLTGVISLVGDREWAERLVALFAASFPEPNPTQQAIAVALPAEACPVAAVVPFSSERRWSALTFASPGPAGAFFLGAPEALLACAERAQGVDDRIAELSSAGQRVLVLAQSEQPLRPAGGADGTEHGASLPEDLRAVALITLEDEVRPEAKATLDAFARQGVAIKIISGDNPQTVLAIAQRVGLPSTARAISGSALAAVPEDEVGETLDQTTIFGRISPQEKEGIIRDLESNGHFVAMIGDGVNDVLALKRANVGVAMRAGSAAARAVSDIVLLDNSFDVLPKALDEGRRIVNSMMLLIKLFLIRDAATIALILAASALRAPFPLLPPHAAVLGFLTVGVPSLFIVGWASAERPRSESLRAIAIVVLQLGAASALAVITVYAITFFGFGVGVAQARSAVVATSVLTGLVVLVLFWHPLDAPWRVLLSDRRVLALAGGLMIVYLIALYTPGLQRLLELRPVPPADWLLIVPVVLFWFATMRVAVCSWVAKRLTA